jgi:hypothetical protein
VLLQSFILNNSHRVKEVPSSKKESKVRQELSKETKSAFVYAGTSAQFLGSVSTKAQLLQGHFDVAK